jgi:1-acyl-sn-glycerol-3-phosphate acyltransferase
MIEKIRGLFTLVQFTITVSFVIIGMYLFYSKNRTIRKSWARMQLFIMGIKVVEHGKIDNSADMLMMNHQSIMDIVLFEAIGERNIAWVAKKEIADIPWFGRILHAPKMIIVERESKKSLIKLLKDTKDRLNDGRQISIFPEGTRSDGTKVRKFKAGAKVIAEKFSLSVQPVIIIGSHDVFKSKELKQKSGQVDIIYLPVIEAKKGTDWYEELEKNMRETFEKYLKERSE